MLDNLLLAFQSVATPTGLLYILLGGAAGMILGAIPGLGGGMLTVVLLPVTYKMEPGLALALLMSIYIGSTSGGCIGSILLGIPGTGASIPTCWDGYQFTRKGDPVRALSTAVFCNFIGTLPSLILAVILCPFIANWAVKLGPWEYFSLCFCAVTLVIALSKDDIVKGFISMGLALLMCCLGTDPVGGTQRFTFGNMYMLNGIDMVNLLMGLFAARNILMEYARDTKKKESVSIKVDRFRWPMKDIKEHLPLIFRCFSLGAIIGFMPGLGANTASVLAYSSEKNIAEKKMKKDPTAEGGIKWGEGNIGGVMAPEVANNWRSYDPDDRTGHSRKWSYGIFYYCDEYPWYQCRTSAFTPEYTCSLYALYCCNHCNDCNVDFTDCWYANFSKVAYYALSFPVSNYHYCSIFGRISDI